jgi:hypothetical protein
MVVGLQALTLVALALYSLFASSADSSLSGTSHLMFVVFTLLFAVGLGLVARGLWNARGWPRMAAVVWFVVLLPVGWGLLQAGRGLVGLLLLGSAAGGIAAIVAESRNAARV